MAGKGNLGMLETMEGYVFVGKTAQQDCENDHQSAKLIRILHNQAITDAPFIGMLICIKLPKFSKINIQKL